MQAGWDEISGIEMNQEYIEIGNARIAYWKTLILRKKKTQMTNEKSPQCPPQKIEHPSIKMFRLIPAPRHLSFGKMLPSSSKLWMALYSHAIQNGKWGTENSTPVLRAEWTVAEIALAARLNAETVSKCLTNLTACNILSFEDNGIVVSYRLLPPPKAAVKPKKSTTPEDGNSISLCPDHGEYVDDDGVCMGCKRKASDPPPLKQGKPKPQPKVRPQRKITSKVAATEPTQRLPGEDLASMVIKALRLKGEMNLPDLLEEVLRLGYKTQSQNLAQAIYNVLGKLKKEGKVGKNETSKTYYLVATA